MLATFYNFTKRKNSTKQPNMQGESYSVALKEETDNVNPTIVVSSFNPVSKVFTYCLLNFFGRYYYISRIRSINSKTWEIDLSLDPLATWKNEILNTSAFVLYSTNVFDSDIPDTRLSTQKGPYITSSSLSLFKTNPSYVVQYVSSDGNAIVFSDYSNFLDLISAINDEGFFKSILDDASNYISKMYNSVTDCIKSAFYLPVTIAHGAVKQPVLGADYLVESAVGNAVPDTTEWNGSISIPWQFNDFRSRSQYTSILVYLPGYGIIQLNPDDYIGQSSITINACLSNLSGDLIYKVGNYAICKCNIATPVQIGTVSSSGFNALGSLATGIATGEPSPITMGINSFNAVLSTLTRNVGSIGMSGGYSSFEIDSNIRVYLISHNTTVNPEDVASVIGRPCNKVVSISSISGYCQTVDFEVNGSMSDDLKEQINNAMNGGVFIE